MTFEQPLILIVDDDRAERLLMKSLLKNEPYRLEFAGDGDEALAKALELTPDLILLDVVMPGKDGNQVCRELRENEVLAEVPVIMVTALEDEESRVAGLSAGADDFISKPFKPSEFRAQIASVTRLNRYARIRDERARFSWVVDNAEEGYVLVNDQGGIVYSNAKARTILSLPTGCDGEQLLPHLQRQFSPSPDDALVGWPNLKPEKVFQLVRPESSMAGAAFIEVKNMVHAVRGRTERLLQLRDVTAQMTSQRSVWSFNALIAHKLRTPLTKMIWGLSFIVDRGEKLTPDKIAEFAKMSLDGVNELKGELDDVLAYLQAPTAVPDGEGFELVRLESVAQELAAQLELKPVRCCLDTPLKGAINLSDRALELTLLELMQNSKKFHPQKSPEIELTAQRKNSTVDIAVRDDGVTLSPEQLRQAFQPYYQGERHFTGQVPGMGLGLSVVSSMVLEVGGECHIRNREDRDGVVVELRLPCF